MNLTHCLCVRPLGCASNLALTAYSGCQSSCPIISHVIPAQSQIGWLMDGRDSGPPRLQNLRGRGRPSKAVTRQTSPSQSCDIHSRPGMGLTISVHALQQVGSLWTSTNAPKEWAAPRIFVLIYHNPHDLLVLWHCTWQRLDGPPTKARLEFVDI